MFLDRAVADHLRNRQRMLTYQKDRRRTHDHYGSEYEADGARIVHTSGKSSPMSSPDITVQKVINDNESEFVGNSEIYAELLQWHQPHPSAEQQLRYRHPRGHQQNRLDNDGSSADFSDSAPSASLHDDNGNDSQYGNYEGKGEMGYEEQFKNVYIKPWTDIGVELEGDDSQFVRLEDSEEEEEEDQPTSNFHDHPSCHRNRDNLRRFTENSSISSTGENSTTQANACKHSSQLATLTINQ